MTEPDLRSVADRVETLVEELGRLSDARARGLAEQLVRRLMELYGGGLARLLELVEEAGGEPHRLHRSLAADPLVGGLLALHGLHPQTVEERVAQALERVRPYLGSHGGDVELLGVEDGRVRLALAGSCDGCPSSAVTLELAIRGAIEEAAPEVVGIDVEGGLAAGAAPPAPSPLVQIGTGGAAAPERGEWIILDEAPALAPGELAALEHGPLRLVLCRVNGCLYAYRDACPSCGSALRGGRLEGELLSCPGCGRGYDVQRAGRGAEAEDLHLEPFPLLRHGGGIRISIPAAPA